MTFTDALVTHPSADAAYSNRSAFRSNLTMAEDKITSLGASPLDLEGAEAALQRIKSVLEASNKEKGDPLQRQSELNGRISAQASHAVEEELQETIEKLAVPRNVSKSGKGPRYPFYCTM